MIYFVPYDSWDFDAQIFAFDIDLSESRVDAWKWTKYALEGGSEYSDHAIEEPRKYSVSGIVSAWYSSTDDEVYTRLVDVHAALVEFAQTRQPVTLIVDPDLWTDDLVIEKITAKRDRSTGDAIEITIDLVSFAVVDYVDVEVPAELLAPKVKASAKTSETSGEAADQEVDASEPENRQAGSVVADLAAGDSPMDALDDAIDRYAPP